MAGNVEVVVIHREKNSSVYFKDFTDFFNNDVFAFSLTNASLPNRWCKACALRWAVSHAVASEALKRNTFDYIGKTF